MTEWSPTNPGSRQKRIHFQPGWSLPPPARGGNHPPQFPVESLPPPARVGNHPPQFQVGSLPPPATSGGPADPPPEREGSGDSTWANWYQRTMHGVEGGTSEFQGPPYPIGMMQVRREAISQIYWCMDGKDLPPRNIASETLRAYYSGVDPQTLNTWACQILCMISEYHMACMTRGSLVTSPILPCELEDRLPPLTDYASLEDWSGATDVRIRDHQARTLQVAVWCHWLDMALSEEPVASESLVRTRHHLGYLLAYFLGPGTTWELQFKDIVTQVLKENQRHLEKKCTDASSSLRKCRNR